MNESTDRDLAPRVLIAAFQGWSDAGDATSEALQHLIGLQKAELLHIIGGESFVDLQLQRPKVFRDEQGRRAIDWPDTRLYGTVHRPGTAGFGAAAMTAAGLTPPPAADAAAEETETITRIDGSPVHDLFFMPGYEPGRDWENFADEVVELAEVWGVDLVVLLGSMYSDAPHSRPIITNVTSEDPTLRERYGAERSEYEGPAGILTAVEIALEAATIGSLSLWVQVPHYVHSAPSPKATLAILDKLEELLDIVIPRGELFAQATDWESNINRIAENDDDMTRYIRSLEEARDEALAAETTGDALAAEFEKFLEQDSRDDKQARLGSQSDGRQARPEPEHSASPEQPAPPAKPEQGAPTAAEQPEQSEQPEQPEQPKQDGEAGPNPDGSDSDGPDPDGRDRR
ncbi:proteasome assembly chaperone family protein [Leucobacter komagatae]|uniref:proteasome assembly chaperone family protein n=1 Tax=Leucobacter komagatae TaxID=55969 RepID=UPI0006977516|nr:PAC2 family protein [Leucobacter komagatae]